MALSEAGQPATAGNCDWSEMRYGLNPFPATSNLSPMWGFEETGMPSYDHILASSDGMYYCQHDKCSGRHGFPQRGLLRRHMRIHVKPVVCQLCRLAVADRGDMMRHLETHKLRAGEHHMSTNNFRCPRCDEEKAPFTRRDNLLRHLTNIHGLTSSAAKELLGNSK